MRVAPDVHDIIVWRMNEGSLPLVNSSTSPNSAGSAANLVTINGTVILDALSLFGEKCIAFPAYSTWPGGSSTTKNRILTASAPALPTPMSVSGWIKIRNLNTGATDNNGLIVVKRYRTSASSWSEPFVAVAMTWVPSTPEGQWRSDVTLAGTRNSNSMLPKAYPLPTGSWTHVGMTFDGSFHRTFLNGSLVAESSASGSIDNGENGQWVFGAGVGDSAVLKSEPAANFCDWRVADVARPASYFENVYRRGVLTW